MFVVIITTLYCINILFTALRMWYTVLYTKDVTLIQDLFLYVSGKFTMVSTIFNTIRKVIYTDISYFKYIQDFNSWTSILEEQSTYVNTNLNNFPLAKKIWDQMDLKIADPQMDINILCGSNPYCVNVLTDDQGINYCNDGINLGINAMLHKFTQIVQELGEYNRNISTLDDIREYNKIVNINDIETTVEFVISQVQVNLYDNYDKDSKDLRRMREKNLAVICSVTFVIGTGMILAIVVLHLVKIKRLVQAS